ncbi:MAG TPA: hypothetical protein VLL54_15905 [Pyrinomonadaceae bacterium]|nr:hypothetical protein [Pyrinomonadaceae bacterium]
MTKIPRALVLIALVIVCVSAQEPKPSVSDTEFQKVLVAVSNEDWDTSLALSAKYLKQMEADDERLPRLRYIYLYSAAGKVSAGRMKYDELEPLVKGFVSKEMALPFRPITLNCRGAFNFICPSDDSNTKFMVAASTKAATTILAFEYVQLKAPFDFASHEDEAASVVGNVDAIVPNPNKSRVLILRLYITKATIELKEPRTQISINRFNF